MCAPPSRTSRRAPGPPPHRQETAAKRWCCGRCRLPRPRRRSGREEKQPSGRLCAGRTSMTEAHDTIFFSRKKHENAALYAIFPSSNRQGGKTKTMKLTRILMLAVAVTALFFATPAGAQSRGHQGGNPNPGNMNHGNWHGGNWHGGNAGCMAAIAFSSVLDSLIMGIRIGATPFTTVITVTLRLSLRLPGGRILQLRSTRSIPGTGRKPWAIHERRWWKRPFHDRTGPATVGRGRLLPWRD